MTNPQQYNASTEGCDGATPEDAPLVAPGKRWWFHFWHWKLEEWRLFFNFFQAFGAVAVAGLAIWGVFFTAFPEAVVRQLRADVADAREELVGLRGERNRLVASVAEINATVVQTNERAQQAEAKEKRANEELGRAALNLRNAQEKLTAEKGRFEALQTEANELQAASAAARSRFSQLEADIKRLAADREGYLRATQGNAMFRARLALAGEIRRYQTAIVSAESYLDAPRWDAREKEYAERMQGKSAAEQARLLQEKQDQRELSEGEAGRLTMLQMARWTRDRPPSRHDTRTLTGLAAAELDRSTELPNKTGRELILSQFAAPGTFTPSDFATFRRALDIAIQAKPLLRQSVLVNKEIVEQRGEAAANEIARASAAIRALDQFLDEFQGRPLTAK
jgi:DNA repair exonuclease SbcCD ATPase subunit